MTEARISLPRKDMMFLAAAEALIGTRDALPKKLDPDGEEYLREVSNILQGAYALQTHCKGTIVASDVPDHSLSLEARKVLASPLRLQINAEGEPFWKRVSDTVATINAVVVGQQRESLAIADAAELCTAIGAHLTQLYLNTLSSEDDD